MKSTSEIVVRMAPSPTGNLHIGGVRTALFNYLFAKHNGGKYILRIEDTDKERNRPEYEEDILNGFKWLGIEHDELFRQSERTEIYKKYLKQMIDGGFAYVSKEEPKEEGQRDEVIRFKNPNKKISFEDMIRGTVEVDTTDLGDFVVARSLEEPVYHLAVVADDFDMGVTHVIRGEEHVSNTPRQILIQEAIGAPRPVYAHLPVIVDEERKKLSKRKHGAAVWLSTYRDEGYLPEAVINYLALLGWNPGTDQEIFSVKELIEQFDFAHVQKSSAFFDVKKLRWVNKEHMKKLPSEDSNKFISDKIKMRYPDSELSEELISVIKERIETYGDLDKLLSEGEFEYFFSEPDIDTAKISWKGENLEITKKHLERVKELISGEEDIMAYAEEVGKGNVLWPLRYSLSGREKSPDPFTLLRILGKEKALERVSRAIDLL